MTQDYRDLSRQELYGLAKEREIEGRSRLSREELVEALELDDVGPDAVVVLLEQHEEIRELFARFAELSPRPSKKKQTLVRGMVAQLLRHARLEEQLFYPIVRSEFPDLGDEVDEDLEEHHVVELLLSELEVMAPSEPRYDAKVSVLIQTMLAHLDEEEDQLFGRVRDELDERRRRELGAAMSQAWTTVATRPGLHVASGPVEQKPAETSGDAGEKDAGSSDEDGDYAMTRSEEELRVATTTRPAGKARLRKQVVTEHVTETVPVQRESAVVEREPIPEAEREEVTGGLPIEEGELEVTLYDEEPVVDKMTVPKERVRLEKTTRTDHQVVGGEVAREEVEVEMPDDNDEDQVIDLGDPEN